MNINEIDFNTKHEANQVADLIDSLFYNTFLEFNPELAELYNSLGETEQREFKKAYYFDLIGRL